MKELSGNKGRIHKKLFLIFSALVLVTLPFSVRLNGLAIILLSANWLIEGNWREKYVLLRQNKYALLLVSLYLLHIVGLAYTENIDQGFSELEKKVAFVVFPVIFATTPYLNAAVVLKLLKVFVLTCFTAAAISLANGLYHYLLHDDSSYLFYHKLGAVINFDHAVYFSFYIGFSIFIVITQLTKGWRLWKKRVRLAYILVICFLLFFLILLSSKTVIIAVLLLLAVHIGRIIFNNKGVLTALAACALCLIFTAILVLMVPNVRDRFEEVIVDKYEQTNPLFLDDYLYYHFTGAAIRLAIWKMSIEVVAEKNAWLFGVGTGDSQDLLTSIYIEKHVYPGDKSLGIKGFLHYNAHNQFFQFFLMFGFSGLGLFIYILLSLYKVARKRSLLLLFFLLLFISFCLTESTLHVQKGIVFFSFFSVLLGKSCHFADNESS